MSKLINACCSSGISQKEMYQKTNARRGEGKLVTVLISEIMHSKSGERTPLESGGSEIGNRSAVLGWWLLPPSRVGIMVRGWTLNVFVTHSDFTFQRGSLRKFSIPIRYGSTSTTIRWLFRNRSIGQLIFRSYSQSSLAALSCIIQWSLILVTTVVATRVSLIILFKRHWIKTFHMMPRTWPIKLIQMSIRILKLRMWFLVHYKTSSDLGATRRLISLDGTFLTSPPPPDNFCEKESLFDDHDPRVVLLDYHLRNQSYHPSFNMYR